MCSSTLYAVSVVNTTLSSLRIHIKVLQVIVEVDGTSAEIASEQGGMSGKDGSHINFPLLAER
jgi:dihydroorotate dehydrogenase